MLRWILFQEIANKEILKRGVVTLHYRNGKDVLPPQLLTEIQKYLEGELIYIPKSEDKKASWGALTGARDVVRCRNRNITDKYKNGSTISELQEEYCLSESSIRKIVCRCCGAG